MELFFGHHSYNFPRYSNSNAIVAYIHTVCLALVYDEYLIENGSISDIGMAHAQPPHTTTNQCLVGGGDASHHSLLRPQDLFDE